MSPEHKKDIQDIIERYQLTDGRHYSGLRRNSMACVAFPTCGLAMAESERYLPSLIGKIEDLLDEAGVSEEDITIRMTGCPNGCASGIGRNSIYWESTRKIQYVFRWWFQRRTFE